MHSQFPTLIKSIFPYSSPFHTEEEFGEDQFDSLHYFLFFLSCKLENEIMNTILNSHSTTLFPTL